MNIEIEKLKNMCLKDLTTFVNEKLTTETLDQTINVLNNVLKKYFVQDAIDFGINLNSDLFEIYPKNIYTALIIDGIDVPYELVKDLDEYETKSKKYCIKDGKVVVVYKEKIKIFTATMTISP